MKKLIFSILCGDIFVGSTIITLIIGASIGIKFPISLSLAMLVGFLLLSFLISSQAVRIGKTIECYKRDSLVASAIFFPGSIVVVAIALIFIGIYKLHKLLSAYDITALFKSTPSNKSVKSFMSTLTARSKKLKEKENTAYRTNANETCKICGQNVKADIHQPIEIPYSFESPTGFPGQSK